MELFARVVAAGSFAQAARDLGLTRAAISQRVSTIEAQIGMPLFARTTRALGLTEAGRRLAPRARAVLEVSEAARRAMRKHTHEGLIGTVRVTAAPSFGQNVLAPLLAGFQAAHPGLKLELSLTQRRVDLLREDVDVAFRLTAKPPLDCVALPVMAVQVRAFAAPRASLPLVEPAALVRERCLLYGAPVDEVSLRWRSDSGQARQVRIQPTMVADDLGTLLAIARAGNGVVFAPDFTALADIATGALVDALPGWRLLVPEGDRMQALMLPLAESSEAARCLVRHVRDALTGPAPQTDAWQQWLPMR